VSIGDIFASIHVLARVFDVFIRVNVYTMISLMTRLEGVEYPSGGGATPDSS